MKSSRRANRSPIVSTRKQNASSLTYNSLERRELLACIHVGGEISVDTIWNSPDGYCIDEKLTIINDAVLVVEDTKVTRLDSSVSSSADNFIEIRDGQLTSSGSTFDGMLPKIEVGVEGVLSGDNTEFISESRLSIDVYGQIVLNSSSVNSNLLSQDLHLRPGSNGTLRNSSMTGDFLFEAGSTVSIFNTSFQGRMSIAANLLPDLDEGAYFPNTFLISILGDISEDLTIEGGTSARFELSSLEIKPDVTVDVEAGVLLRFADDVRVAGNLTVESATLTDSGAGRLTILNGGTVDLASDSNLSLGSIDVLTGGSLNATDSVLSGDIAVWGLANMAGNNFAPFGSLQLKSGATGSISKNSISMPIEIDSNSSASLTQNFIVSNEVKISGDSTETVDIGNNYWNTTNLEDVATRIVDQNDDASRPLALFEPILSESPLSLDIVGTEESDSISISLGLTGDRFNVYFNGTDRTLQNLSKYSSISVEGRGGEDSVQISLREGDSHAELFPLSASITNGTLPIELSGFRTISVNHFSEGVTTARLHGSSGDDSFRSDTSSQLLRGANYENQITGFDSFQVDLADNGGVDEAIVSSITADTHFIFRDDRLAVLDIDQQGFLSGFDRYSIKGTIGGNNNKVTYWGTEGNDSFIAGNGASTFETPDVFIEAELFASATARGNGGFDVARIADSPLDDNLFARPGQVFLSNENGTVANAFDFDNVTVISTETESGFDSATLFGSESDERFSGSRTFSELKNGDSFVRAYHFSRVTAQSGGGTDEAFLYDSERDDKFVVSPTYNAMFSSDYRVGAIGFPTVTGVSNSGFDIAHFTDSDGDDVLFTTPVFSRMTNSSTERLAIGFAEVYANSSAGVDQAIFRDSSGDDIFVAKPNSAIITGDGFQNFAVGFASTFATSTGGDDIARFVDSVNDDSLFMDSNGTRLKGDGFNNFASGFERSLVFSIGGNDFANLVDSEDNDFLGGKDDDLWMFNNDYYRFIHGFETIQAGAINGGVNRANTDVAFELELFGDWLE